MQGERIPVDPRVVESITRNSSMMLEQGSGFLQKWGGPEKYKAVAKMDPVSRVVYVAMLDGENTSDGISFRTGLTKSEIAKASRILKSRGVIPEALKE